RLVRARIEAFGEELDDLVAEADIDTVRPLTNRREGGILSHAASSRICQPFQRTILPASPSSLRKRPSVNMMLLLRLNYARPSRQKPPGDGNRRVRTPPLKFRFQIARRLTQPAFARLRERRLVPVEGIEPPFLSERDFESRASTSSATRA